MRNKVVTRLGSRLISPSYNSGRSTVLGRSSRIHKDYSQQMNKSSFSTTAFSSVPSVQSTIDSNPVAIFSKTTCGFCTRLKWHFKDLDINPAVVELNKDPNGLNFHEKLIQLTGQRTVPYVFIHGEFIGGHDDTISIPDDVLMDMVNEK
mmetsp:Transcript_987/g.1248  ORF Transcript_987/g.1248 Transcript_987/m.1248 type:complete len:149 (-) Transcript_987:349-795(-)